MIVPGRPQDSKIPILEMCDSVTVRVANGVKTAILPHQYISNDNRVLVIWFSYGDGSMAANITVSTTPCIGTLVNCEASDSLRRYNKMALSPVHHLYGFLPFVSMDALRYLVMPKPDSYPQKGINFP